MSRFLSRLTWTAILALVAVGFAVACGDDDKPAAGSTTAAPAASGSAAAKPTTDNSPKGTLRIATVPPDYGTLAPQDTSSQGLWYRQQVLESLVHLQVTKDSVQFQPMLAESWKTDKDRTTFTLRKGIQFQKNMGEMTCDDVLFSANLLIAKDAVSASLMTPNWNGFKAQFSCTDPYTFVVAHNGQYVDVLYDFSDWWYVQIQSKKYYDSVGNDQARKIVVGTGPFEMLTMDATGMTYKAVANHWRKTPEFASLTWKFIAEDSTRLAALQAGEVDIAELPLTYTPQVKQDSKFSIVTTSSASNFTVGMWGGLVYPDRAGYDASNPLLDKRVRQALNLAINRKELNDKVLYGLADPVVNSPYFWPGTPGYIADLPQYPYDVATAKKLLADAGKSGGFTITFIDSGPIRAGVEAKDIGDALSAYWQPLNVKVNIVKMDQATINSLRRSRDPKLNSVVLLLNASYRPLQAPSALYGSKAVATFGERKDFDDLLTKFAETGDTSVNGQINRTAWDDYMSIPLFRASPIAVFNKSTIAEYPLSFNSGLQDLEYIKRK